MALTPCHARHGCANFQRLVDDSLSLLRSADSPFTWESAAVPNDTQEHKRTAPRKQGRNFSKKRHPRPPLRLRQQREHASNKPLSLKSLQSRQLMQRCLCPIHRSILCHPRFMHNQPSPMFPRNPRKALQLNGNASHVGRTKARPACSASRLDMTISRHRADKVNRLKEDKLLGRQF